MNPSSPTSPVRARQPRVDVLGPASLEVTGGSIAPPPKIPFKSAPGTPPPTHLAASGNYSSSRRHSLYGTEDRIVLDPGTRVWKVGFSGEGRPRDVFAVKPRVRGGEAGAVARIEDERATELDLQDRLRVVFFKSLLADPKSRKVIIVEPPLMSLAVKDMFARILFQNLEVPSISFMPSHLLSLLGVGRVTGLVVDVGHTETVVMPIYSSRPLYSFTHPTLLAGARLTAHLRVLLTVFGTYKLPPSVIRASAGVASAPSPVPTEILTDDLLESIKTRFLFVGTPLPEGALADLDEREFKDEDVGMEVDSVDSASESGHSTASRSNASPAPSSSASVGTPQNPHVSSENRSYSKALAAVYARHSAATDIHLPVVPPPQQAQASGSAHNARGTLIIPGWIRERCAEILFEIGDVDERSVTECVLDVLLKAPMDLRRTLASSILVVGGTAMLPGFIQRLHAELLKMLSTPNLDLPSSVPAKRSTPTPSGRSSPPNRMEVETELITPTATRFPHIDFPSPKKRPRYDPYTPIKSLAPHIAIVNNPSRTQSKATDGPQMSSSARKNAGKAPAFAPALLPWVGGSLAGALKIGADEVSREAYDEAVSLDEESQRDELETLAASSSSPTQPPSTKRPVPVAQAIGASIALEAGGLRPPGYAFLPDWTRGSLMTGAPNAVWIPPQEGAPVDVAG